jgi:transcriptional regulator NrdR family protein
MGDKFGCPVCGSTNLKVTNTYSGAAAICRRRVCQRCGHVFDTAETVAGQKAGLRKIIKEVTK